MEMNWDWFYIELLSLHSEKKWVVVSLFIFLLWYITIQILFEKNKELKILKTIINLKNNKTI